MLGAKKNSPPLRVTNEPQSNWTGWAPPLNCGCQVWPAGTWPITGSAPVLFRTKVGSFAHWLCMNANWFAMLAWKHMNRSPTSPVGNW